MSAEQRVELGQRLGSVDRFAPRPFAEDLGAFGAHVALGLDRLQDRGRPVAVLLGAGQHRQVDARQSIMDFVNCQPGDLADRCESRRVQADRIGRFDFGPAVDGVVMRDRIFLVQAPDGSIPPDFDGGALVAAVAQILVIGPAAGDSRGPPWSRRTGHAVRTRRTGRTARGGRGRRGPAIGLSGPSGRRQPLRSIGGQLDAIVRRRIRSRQRRCGHGRRHDRRGARRTIHGRRVRSPLGCQLARTAQNHREGRQQLRQPLATGGRQTTIDLHPASELVQGYILPRSTRGMGGRLSSKPARASGTGPGAASRCSGGHSNRKRCSR